MFEDSNIHRLSELKPAGTKLILDSRTDLIELIKLTLFDLTLKQVLVIKKTFRKSHQRDPHLREYVIVRTGKNFAKYEPSRFEQYFINRINKDSYFQLKIYLRAVINEIPSEYRHRIEIVENLRINQFFNDSFVLSIFSVLRINKKGKTLRSDISQYLNEVDEHIGILIDKEPEKALELILFLQGNIFLLKNLKFELLEKLKLVSDIRMNRDDESYEDWYWIDFIYDSDFSISNLISEVSELLDSIEDYFDSYDGGDWDSGYDSYDLDF